jgi:hypothetical protein
MQLNRGILHKILAPGNVQESPILLFLPVPCQQFQVHTPIPINYKSQGKKTLSLPLKRVTEGKLKESNVHVLVSIDIKKEHDSTVLMTDFYMNLIGLKIDYFLVIFYLDQFINLN